MGQKCVCFFIIIQIARGALAARAPSPENIHWVQKMNTGLSGLDERAKRKSFMGFGRSEP